MFGLLVLFGALLTGLVVGYAAAQKPCETDDGELLFIATPEAKSFTYRQYLDLVHELNSAEDDIRELKYGISQYNKLLSWEASLWQDSVYKYRGLLKRHKRATDSRKKYYEGLLDACEEKVETLNNALDLFLDYNDKV